jgi:hypothetical protein
LWLSKATARVSESENENERERESFVVACIVFYLYENICLFDKTRLLACSTCMRAMWYMYANAHRSACKHVNFV